MEYKNYVLLYRTYEIFLKISQGGSYDGNTVREVRM